MTSGAANGWVRQDEAELAYQDALAADPSENLAASVANSLAWTYLDLGDFRKAYDTLYPLFDKYRDKAFSPTGNLNPVNVTVWNIAEIMHTFSVTALKARGECGLPLGREAFRKAVEAYRHCGLRAYVVREGFLSIGAEIRARYAEHESIIPVRAPLTPELYGSAIALAKRITAS
jgi:tetratricopeptide (TPR) repeat protein